MLDLRFGEFECDDGWNNIIWEALEKIEQLQDYKDLKGTENEFKIPIIKEKYGSLRIQYFGGTEEIYRITEEAEKQSETICEHCGCESVVRLNRGWYSSVCKKCVDKSDKGL